MLNSFSKFFAVVRVFISNRHELDWFIFECVHELIPVWHGLDAGAAPCCPEINNDDFAAERLPVEACVGGSLQKFGPGNRRCRCANANQRGVGRSRHKKEAANTRHSLRNGAPENIGVVFHTLVTVLPPKTHARTCSFQKRCLDTAEPVSILTFETLWTTTQLTSHAR
jgi:hypothetical protein